MLGMLDKGPYPTFMLKTFLLCGFLVVLPVCARTPLQDTAAATPAKPTEQVLGTVTAIDPSAHTITVKQDKTLTEYVVSVAETRTLLKVAPGAKDLHSAVRITAPDLVVGDRVDVRGFKADTPNGIKAKSVVVMSATDLAEKHQAELQAWQNSTVGSVASVDPSTHSVKISVRSSDGPKPVTVQTSAATEFTRYSPDNPKMPSSSQFTDIQSGDQIHVVGQKNADGDSVAAEKIYSAPVRTVAATVTSVSSDGKQLVVKNLQTKQPATILLNDDSSVRKLPPQMAMMLARRLNPAAANANGSGANPNQAGHAAPANQSQGQASPGTNGPGPNGPGGAPRGGDMSRMLERVPTISASDLKAGDAVVVWGFVGHDPSSLVAKTVLAGVEPVLQSAPPRQGQSLGGDWGLDMAVPAQ
jgi:hypothetical protein